MDRERGRQHRQELAAWPGDLRGVVAIARYVELRFAAWGLRLPASAVEHRHAGHLFENGWHFGWKWGADESGEYLEFLAQHRMTDDQHLRVYADRIDNLEVPTSWIPLPEGVSDSERIDLEKRHTDDQRRIYAQLRRDGLLPESGANLPAHEIREFLTTGGNPEEER